MLNLLPREILFEIVKIITNNKISYFKAFIKGINSTTFKENCNNIKNFLLISKNCSQIFRLNDITKQYYYKLKYNIYGNYIQWSNKKYYIIRYITEFLTNKKRTKTVLFYKDIYAREFAIRYCKGLPLNYSIIDYEKVKRKVDICKSCGSQNMSNILSNKSSYKCKDCNNINLRQHKRYDDFRRHKKWDRNALVSIEALLLIKL